MPGEYKCHLTVDKRKHDFLWKPASREWNGSSYSRVWFCPLCSTIWAALIVEGSDNCICRRGTCTDCYGKYNDQPDYYIELDPFPGSLITDLCVYAEVDYELLQGLPPDLLKRELNLTFKQYENDSGTPSTNLSTEPFAERDAYLKREFGLDAQPPSGGECTA